MEGNKNLLRSLKKADAILTACCDLALTAGAELCLENEPKHAVDLFDALGCALDEASGMIHSAVRFCGSDSEQAERDMLEACDFDSAELMTIATMAEDGSIDHDLGKVKDAMKRAGELFPGYDIGR